MGKKKLCLYVAGDKISFIELQTKGNALFPQPRVDSPSSIELDAACKRASDIYINVMLDKVIFKHEIFPDIKPKQLKATIEREALKSNPDYSSLHVTLKKVGKTTENNITKAVVAYIAVEKKEIDSILNKFRKFTKKILNINILQASMASAISPFIKTDSNTIIVLTGEKSTTISINSAAGAIKLFRSVPFGVPLEATPENQVKISEFVANISKELAMTTNFFKQNFRETEPENIYFFGNGRLESFFAEHTYSGPPIKLNYQIPFADIHGVDDKFIAENFQILCSLYSQADFNFIPKDFQFYVHRAANLVFSISLILIIACTAAALTWSGRIQAGKAEAQADYDKEIGKLHNIQRDINILQESISKITPLEARKKLYEKSFLSQPDFSQILFNFAKTIPPDIIISNYRLVPAGKEWQNKLAGEIKAENWQQGLAILREFGKTIQTSSIYLVNNLEYTLGELEEMPKKYSFTLELKLDPLELKPESDKLLGDLTDAQ